MGADFVQSESGSRDIPPRRLVPEAMDALLAAGRAISGKHEVQGSVRIVPDCMAAGQAARAAAALSAKPMLRRKKDLSRIQNMDKNR